MSGIDQSKAKERLALKSSQLRHLTTVIEVSVLSFIVNMSHYVLPSKLTPLVLISKIPEIKYLVIIK